MNNRDRLYCILRGYSKISGVYGSADILEIADYLNQLGVTVGEPDSDEPLPCPFCGKENPFVGTQDMIEGREIQSGSDAIDWAVCCDARHGGCGAVGGYARTEELAIEKWNRRVNHAKQP